MRRTEKIFEIAPRITYRGSVQKGLVLHKMYRINDANHVNQIYNQANEIRKSDAKQIHYIRRNYKIIYWRVLLLPGRRASGPQGKISCNVEMRKDGIRPIYMQWLLLKGILGGQQRTYFTCGHKTIKLGVELGHSFFFFLLLLLSMPSVCFLSFFSVWIRAGCLVKRADGHTLYPPH